jgi:hypothetical protein
VGVPKDRETKPKAAWISVLISAMVAHFEFIFARRNPRASEVLLEFCAKTIGLYPNMPGHERRLSRAVDDLNVAALQFIRRSSQVPRQPLPCVILHSWVLRRDLTLLTSLASAIAKGTL